MAIKLNSLKQRAIENTELNFNPTYTDLHLDLKESYTLHNQLNRKFERKDIVLDYDAGAINNSLHNLFNTIPGQKLLTPGFGLNLHNFLFSPLNQFVAENIGYTIYATILMYEPRITVTNINVAPDYDNNQYIIDIHYRVPLFNNGVVYTYNTTLTKI